jgi:putative membrane protein
VIVAAAGCAAGAVLAQIAHPLLDGAALTTATLLAVVLFALAGLVHSLARYGRRGPLALLVGAAGLGLLVEAVGVRTGIPFGAYRYSGTLRPQLLGVPAVVPLAWLMMTYPCVLLGRRLTPAAGQRWRRVVLGGWTLAAWDLFLDPQMVAAGHWVWRDPAPHLPGVAQVPLTNYAGWLVVSTMIVAITDRLLPEGPVRRASDAVPGSLLAWTWLGSTLANLAFFDRPWVALYGGVAMGLTVGPYLWAAFRRPRVAARPSPVGHPIGRAR